MTSVPHVRFLGFLAVFVAAAAGLTSFRGLDFPLGLALGFDFAALAFLGSIVPLLRDAGSTEDNRARAARDDGGRVLLLVVAAVTLCVVIVAVGMLVVARDNLGGGDLALVAGTLLLAWLFMNSVFAFHYSHLYHDQRDGRDSGGLTFPGEDAPLFADFCYFALVIGMTSQTADVAMTAGAMRRVAALHGLFAFVFNLGVMAMMINVVAGVLAG